MMLQEPIVLAVILNWKSPYECIGLIQSLKNNSYDNLLILLIDNCSEDNSIEIIKSHFTNIITIETQKNIGYAGGNNIGLLIGREIGVDYIWVLNPDIRIEKNTLRELLETIKRDKEIAAIGPRICSRGNKYLIYSDGCFLELEKGYLAHHINNNIDFRNVIEIQEIQDVDYVNGCSILISVSAFNKIGFFRVDFFMYYDETEWCLRAREKGYKILSNRKALVYNKSSKKNNKYYFYMNRNRILMAKLNHNRKYLARTLYCMLSEIVSIGTTISAVRSIPVIPAKVFGLVAGILTKPKTLKRNDI